MTPVLWRTLRCEVPATDHLFRLILTSCFPFLCGELADNHKGPRHLQEMQRSKIPTSQKYFYYFQLLWKQQIFLFPDGQDGSPRRCPERQRPAHGDQDEENDRKPQVSEMHTGGQEIRHMLRRKEFCHHAAEMMLEERRVHRFWMEAAVTASLGFSYLWKMSY